MAVMSSPADVSTTVRRGYVVRLPSAPVFAVFVAAYAAMLLTMSALPSTYDEGVVLTAAMRVAAGQVPHRDFYTSYGAANYYLLAAGFRWLGTSILTERVLYGGFCAALVAVLFRTVEQFTRRSVALVCAAVGALSLIAMNATSGFALIPAALCNILAVLALQTVFQTAPQRGRLLWAGIAGGLAGLFRYDTGLGTCAVALCVVAVAAFTAEARLKQKVKKFVVDCAVYLGGCLLAVSLPVLYYRFGAHGRFADIFDHVFRFPAHFYRLGRSLPFPGLQTRLIVDGIAYLLPASILLTLAICVPQIARWTREGRGSNTQASRLQTYFLLCFGIDAAVMYGKGLVRISFAQVEMATLPVVMLLGLLCASSDLHRLARSMSRVLAFLLAMCVLLAAGRQVHILVQQRGTMFATLHRPGPGEPDSLRKRWCDHGGPLTRPLCFVEDEDRMQAILFLQDHTTPQDTLYVGNTHHDRVFANDNITYFAAERLPATRWSNFEPYLQNSAGTQQEMIAELSSRRPPYVVLDAEFNDVHEPNGSSLSSGVTLLDDYLRRAYVPAVVYGRYTVLKRVS